MSNTAQLNIINLQVFAEAQAALDRENGTFDENQAASRYHYIWQSEFQTIPMGMNGEPEQFAEKIAESLPQVNCLRIPFNIHSFNADGTLDPLFERFLYESVRQGLQIIPVLADGKAQQLTGTSEHILSALDGDVFGQIQGAWETMMAWMSQNPEVKAAVYGWELINEPASYKRAVDLSVPSEKAATQSTAVGLYIDHITELSRLVSANSDARILVNAWGYSGDTQTLAETYRNGRSAIAEIENGVGDKIVWSLHFYPGWNGTTSIRNADELEPVLSEFIAPMRGADIIFSEINTAALTTFNPFLAEQVSTATALSLEWIKEQGIGIGWFPGVQTGNSGLAFIEGDGGIRYLNQQSLASALNAFSIHEETTAQASHDHVSATLISASLRNQPWEPDYATNPRDTVEGAAFAFGYAGNDTLLGLDHANNFMYGGSGNDITFGKLSDDFLFGQDGDDIIVSGSGIDYIFGGEGNDIIFSDSRLGTIYGGSGSDLIVLEDNADVILADFSLLDGDLWMIGPSALVSAHSEIDLDGDGIDDLVIEFTNSSKLTVISTDHQLTFAEFTASRYTLSGPIASLSSELERGSGSQDLTSLHLAALNHLASFRREIIVSLPETELQTKLFGTNRADYLSHSGQITEYYGLRGSDTIAGGGENDLIFGGSGKDHLLAWGGDDTIFGGSGDDRILGGNGLDRILGGTGQDTLIGAQGHDRLVGGLGGDRLLGGRGRDTLMGGLNNDRLYGGSGGDHLFGGKGNDTVSASSGNDYLHGGSGGDHLFGGKGNDTLLGSLGDDRLLGGWGMDSLHGGRGQDVLRGGSGNDTLRSGSGNDKLYGGAGSDLFIFDTADDRNWVMDFQDGVDQIVLSGGHISFSDIRVSDRGSNDVLIEFYRTTLLISNGQNIEWNRADFVFE